MLEFELMCTKKKFPKHFCFIEIDKLKIKQLNNQFYNFEAIKR